MPAQPLTLSVWYVNRSSEPCWWFSWLYQALFSILICLPAPHNTNYPEFARLVWFSLGFWDHGDQKKFSPLWTLSGHSKTKVIKLSFIFDFTEKGSHVRNAPLENLTFSWMKRKKWRRWASTWNSLRTVLTLKIVFIRRLIGFSLNRKNLRNSGERELGVGRELWQII